MAQRPLPLAGGTGVRRACAGACLLALLLAGCGGGTATSDHVRKGRLDGTVTRGPTTPVCRTGTPCSEPASEALLTFDRAGDSRTLTIGGVSGRVGAGSAYVAKDGTYSVSLPPGVYAVNWVFVGSAPKLAGRAIEPSTVRVLAGRTGKVDFQIDTGIR